MKLLQKWRTYVRDIKSPDSYINMGFYSMISSALARRVWVNPPERPIFPNQYIILVGKPGLGKGMVIKPISELLKYHPRYEHKMTDKDNVVTPQDLEETSATAYDKQSTRAEPDKLFPVAPEATTYEALLRAHARSTRTINALTWDETLGRNLVKPYVHNSIVFLLEEISSLFKKKTENIVNYLLVAWDCSDYTYETKTQGTDRLRKCCLNLLGGTTPDFMERTFSDDILNEGFASRTIFVYEDANRHNRFGIMPFDSEQKQAYRDILDQLKNLSKLYGQVTYTPEAWAYMKHYFEEVHPYKRPNMSLKLEHYYTRKELHVQKLALAIHFADSLEMIIGLEEVVEAMETLAVIERKMDRALTFGGANPWAKIAPKIVKYIVNEGRALTALEIWSEFVQDLPETELQEVLRFLVSTERLISLEDTVNKHIYYDVPNRSKR